MTRSLHTLLATAAVLGVAALLPATAAAQDLTAPVGTVEARIPASDSDYCPQTLVLAVDGTRAPRRSATSLDPKSPLNPIADFKGRELDALVEHVEYPGDLVPGVNGWNIGYDESVEIGKSNLRSRIAQQERACGTATSYVLLGYSQGARIVGDVVSEIDSDRVRDYGLDLQDRITEVDLYADPRTPGTGIEVRYPGPIAPGITLTGERLPYQNIDVQWTCAPEDGVCNTQPVESGSAGIARSFLGYMVQHPTYGNPYK